jgi:hypothetical protein
VEASATIKDRMNCLDKLVGLCDYGSKYCQRIKLDFFLANEILKMDYRQVLVQNEWTTLKSILHSNYDDKYGVSKWFVKTYELDQTNLCDFLLEETVKTLTHYASCQKLNINFPSHNTTSTDAHIFDPDSSDNFSDLVKIFGSNSNIFGTKLLEKSRSLLEDANTSEDFIILTELLIRSHDCFIQSCSMEGISNVLQTCKKCATKLEKAGEFNIMIRLLVGIAYYNEMSYIMDFLWNNNQFEMLVGREIERVI